MGAVFSGGIGPSVVHKSHNREPHVPVILPC